MIGVDIIEIERFRKLAKKDFSLWNKVFTEQEWRYCFSKPLPARHLAGIFAAKEAVMKAVGGAVMKRYAGIEIKHDNSGKPLISIGVSNDGRASRVNISISHNNDTAIAVALVSPSCL